MRIKQLESFVRVCELGSVTKTATELNIAQPALGAQMRSLEREFGIQLLHRTARGTTPTEAGQLLLAEARRIIERVRSLKSTLRDSSDDTLPTFHFGLTPSLINNITNPLLTFFAMRDFRFRLRIHEALSYSLIEQIQTGQLDIALAFDAPANRLIKREPRLREPLFFISARGSELDQQGPISLRDIVGVDFAIPNPAGMIWRMVEEAAVTLGLQIRTPYHIDSMPMLKEIIRSGVAYGILPLASVVREVQSGVLAARKIIEPELLRTLFIIHTNLRDLNYLNEDLIKYVDSLLSRIVEQDPNFVSA